MIRIQDIQNNLFGLVGWRQTYLSADKIADFLTESSSGKYFQDEHPLLTFDNLRSIAPDFTEASYPAYNASVNYKIGDVVSENNILYHATASSINKTPSENSDVWALTDEFSEWLVEKTKASVQKAIVHFYTDKQSKFINKALCENKILFTGTGRLCDTIANRSNYVGFELDFARYLGVSMRINRIGLQFTHPGEYKIYIMHSSSLKPVFTLTLQKTKSHSMEWFTLDNIVLPFASANIDAGGSWYVVYSQNELPENSLAIEKQKDWSKPPCAECSTYEYNSWVAWSKYLEVHPFFVNSEFVDNISDQISMWDISKNQYTSLTNYGLNLEISIECDITDFIIEQRNIFSDVISKQLAVDFLKELAYNPNVRTNRHSINASRQDIMFALDGDASRLQQSGLVYELDKAYKALDFNTRGISKVCLPCKNNGIKYRTV